MIAGLGEHRFAAIEVHFNGEIVPHTPDEWVQKESRRHQPACLVVSGFPRDRVRLGPPRELVLGLLGDDKRGVEPTAGEACRRLVGSNRHGTAKPRPRKADLGHRHGMPCGAKGVVAGPLIDHDTVHLSVKGAG